MKKYPLLIALSFMLSLVYSCGGEEELQNDQVEQAESETAETTTEVDEIEELEGLTLNDGAKWNVDSTTDAGMNRIIEMAGAFDGEDHKQIGKDIKSELSDIISKCTMKGEDHEQYHIVLHAMLKESKRLKKGKSESMDKMNSYLDAYTSHFELAE